MTTYRLITIREDVNAKGAPDAVIGDFDEEEQAEDQFEAETDDEGTLYSVLMVNEGAKWTIAEQYVAKETKLQIGFS